jgi:hypothetical protein
MQGGTDLHRDNDSQTATCTGENGVAGDMFLVHFHVDQTPYVSARRYDE